MPQLYLFSDTADKPSQPMGPLLYDNITHNSVELTWLPPESDGGAPIKGYDIEYRPTNRSTWVKAGNADGTATEFTVTGLQDGTDYMFRVTAINAEGASKPLESEHSLKPEKTIGM